MKREPVIRAGKAPLPKTRAQRIKAGALGLQKPNGRPQDVTGTPIRNQLLPWIGCKPEVGSKRVELIAGLWGHISALWASKGVKVEDDPYGG